ncbi:hypothetical protein AAL_07887 [Moelleriella libera RCEF 2490]|uniref:HRQ family protein 2 n=1 Tax=Moelleriella libera RCEF 2490 TaxID=1081109 RepID=A0A167WJW1_9HYPO|nr:hypothetical protein AAL_07887 [Moelleriella libera RCEF 2490]
MELHASGTWPRIQAIGLSKRFVIFASSFLVIFLFYRLVKSLRRVEREDQQHRKSPPLNAATDGKVTEAAIEPLSGFDWKATEPTRYLPIKPVYHITMALQQDSPSRLITVDRDYLSRVTHRRQLIEQKTSTVHGCLPQGAEAVSELYSYLLRGYLPIRYPTMFTISDDGIAFHNTVTDKTFPLEPPSDPREALRALGETVEEDLFLLHETPEGHLCVAFVCCFPAHFDPSKKMGKVLQAIHGPVPSYNKIGASMERFFSRLQVGKSAKRLNWSIQTHPELHVIGNHVQREAAEKQADDGLDVDSTFVRVELQTLTRLPKTQAILFSFKTYMYGVSGIKNDGLGPELADAIEGLKSGNAPDMWNYKSAGRWAKPVCEFLRS